MTGVGGGSLMTPLLILLFGVHPATAVGTDLLYAAATKSAGTVVHGLHQTIDWHVVGRLAAGSVPTAAATILALSCFNIYGGAAKALMTGMLSSALFATAAVLIFRKKILAYYAVHIGELDPRRTAGLTVFVGAVLGFLVTISSVGAGALGSDIAHAVPLTLAAGIGHWALGSIDWPLLGSLLAGSLPGIVIGSHVSLRVPDAVLRFSLATTLIIVASKLVL
jgi:hypothetical protein